MKYFQRRGRRHKVENKMALFSSRNCNNEKSRYTTQIAQLAEWMLIFYDDRGVGRGKFGTSVVKRVLLCKFVMKKLLPFPTDGAPTFPYTFQPRCTSSMVRMATDAWRKCTLSWSVFFNSLGHLLLSVEQLKWRWDLSSKFNKKINIQFVRQRDTSSHFSGTIPGLRWQPSLSAPSFPLSLLLNCRITD